MTVPPPPGQTPPPPPGQTPPPPPAPGMPPMPPSGGTSQTNGPATTSMVLGIISLLCLGLITGIPAIIFGVIGRKKATEMNGEGSGQAVAGLILGIIGVVWSVIAIVIFIIAAATADNTVRSVNKEYEKAKKESEKINKEYKEQQSRKGDDAKRADFEITKAEVDVSSYGYVTYSAYIENTADFETGFKVKIRCEGDLGDVDTQTAYAYSLSPGDKESLKVYYTFDQDTSTVNCDATEVLYD